VLLLQLLQLISSLFSFSDGVVSVWYIKFSTGEVRWRGRVVYKVEPIVG